MRVLHLSLVINICITILNLKVIPGFIYLNQVQLRQKYYAPQVRPYQTIVTSYLYRSSTRRNDYIYIGYILTILAIHHVCRLLILSTTKLSVCQTWGILQLLYIGFCKYNHILNLFLSALHQLLKSIHVKIHEDCIARFSGGAIDNQKVVRRKKASKKKYFRRNSLAHVETLWCKLPYEGAN